MAQHDGETLDIDGHTYTVFKLDPLVASDLLVDLGGILGPTIASLGLDAVAKDTKAALSAALAGTGDSDNPLLDKVGPGLERAVLAFFQRYSKAQQRELINTLMRVTHIGTGEKSAPLERVFSAHFRGRIGPMYQWLGFALQVQYKDFFSSLKSVIAGAVHNLVQG